MARSDSDRLFSFLLGASKQLLEANGEMYPIAAALFADGHMRQVAAYCGDEHPESQKVLDELSLALTSQASPQRSLALGVAYDIRFTDGKNEKSDAIKIDIEHVDGESIRVITPYSKNAD
jgi:hypothetical protein